MAHYILYDKDGNKVGEGDFEFDMSKREWRKTGYDPNLWVSVPPPGEMTVSAQFNPGPPKLIFELARRLLLYAERRETQRRFLARIMRAGGVN